jgi:periplasmic protein TonB
MPFLDSSRITASKSAFGLLPAARTNPWAVGTATLINGSIFALLLLLGMKTAMPHFPPNPTGGRVDISDLHIFAPATPSPSHGGNGGGDHELIDPTRGRAPQYSTTPIAPPMIPVVAQPKLAEESTVAIRMPDDSALPNIGVSNSTNVSLASNGPGGPHGVGTGQNGTFGPGNGDGAWGPGDGNNIYMAGNGVLAPTLVFAPEPEFSDEARRQKYQGVCIMSVIVDTHGNPQNIHVTRSLGMGLDEKAMEAVRRYKFKPGTKDGKPVPVRIQVEVDFHLL